MAMHAVVVHASTVVGCYVATLITFVLDILISMTFLFAISNPVHFILVISIELASRTLKVVSVVVP